MQEPECSEISRDAGYYKRSGKGGKRARNRENPMGWDCENLIITDLAEQLQDCGIQALTIHGRTRSQMYTGEADWSLIGEVKNNPRIHIPIIGNGDITTPEEAKLAFERYGVDAVMIGRATFEDHGFSRKCVIIWIIRVLPH